MYMSPMFKLMFIYIWADSLYPLYMIPCFVSFIYPSDSVVVCLCIILVSNICDPMPFSIFGEIVSRLSWQFHPVLQALNAYAQELFRAHVIRRHPFGGTKDNKISSMVQGFYWCHKWNKYSCSCFIRESHSL